MTYKKGLGIIRAVDDKKGDIKMKNISELSLYDLMAEDLDVWIKPNAARSSYDLEIDDECGSLLTKEEDIHPFAMDAFADFCKRYLRAYEMATQRAAA